MVKGDLGVLLQGHVGSEGIAEGRGDVVIAATDISVLLEHFSHDIQALVTSSSRGGDPGQTQGSATHRGLSFRICPHGCPYNGCAEASTYLLVHSHPCPCQENRSPLSMLLYVKPHLPSVLCAIHHVTQLIRSEEQFIFFFFIFPSLHYFCRAKRNRNKSDSSVRS